MDVEAGGRRLLGEVQVESLDAVSLFVSLGGRISRQALMGHSF
jgi:hypothetical protein